MGARPKYDPAWTYPGQERSYFEDWGDRFEAIFVWLHPFFKVDGVTPQYQRLTLADLDGREVEFFCWDEVGKGAGLPDPLAAKVHVALATTIGAIKRPFVRTDWVEKIKIWAEANDVFWPVEEVVDITMVKPMASLSDAAEKSVWSQRDEFGPQPVEEIDFHSPNVDHQIGFRVFYWLADPDIVVTTGFDRFYTLVAGPSHLLANWVDNQGLDGFFADKATNDGWWLSHSKTEFMNSKDAEQ